VLLLCLHRIVVTWSQRRDTVEGNSGLSARASSWCDTRHPSELAAPCASHTPHVTRHTSHVTRHTSHVTRHAAQVTHHTSHVTRHAAQVTRYKSNVTCRTAGYPFSSRDPAIRPHAIAALWLVPPPSRTRPATPTLTRTFYYLEPLLYIHRLSRRSTCCGSLRPCSHSCGLRSSCSSVASTNSSSISLPLLVMMYRFTDKARKPCACIRDWATAECCRRR
jgi:hypothetical protein